MSIRRLRRRRGSAANASGFTLIEILLATALLAAGLAVGFATLTAATASVNRGEALAQQNESMRAVAAFLRARISSARAIGFGLDQDTGLPMRFIGEPERMRFVADLPDYLGRGGPYLHDISVAREGAQTRLRIAFSMAQNAATISEDVSSRQEELADGLSRVQFRYRAIGADGVLGEWQDRWTRSDQLPLQVSVRITPAGRAPWPELVIALPSSSAAAAIPGEAIP